MPFELVETGIERPLDEILAKQTHLRQSRGLEKHHNNRNNVSIPANHGKSVEARKHRI